MLRQDPDVILIGEMRDEETVHTALSAAETGHLVLSTLHTIDAPETVNRIVDFFPPHQQQQARAMLAGTLKGIISQRLVPTPDRRGRVAVCEVLRMTGRAKDMILDPEQTGRLREVIAEGEFYGMQTFDQALLHHVQAGRVSMEDAMRVATSPHDFKLLVAAEGRRATSMEDVGGGGHGEPSEPRARAGVVRRREPVAPRRRAEPRGGAVARPASAAGGTVSGAAPPRVRAARRSPLDRAARPHSAERAPAAVTSVWKVLRYHKECMASNDSCPVCRTAEVVCGKWTLLIIRDLADGRSRFCELERSLAGISPRTLSLRLRALEEEGIVERRTYPEVPPRVEYALTEKGRALVPIIEDMRTYGRRWLNADGCCAPAADVAVAPAAAAVA